MIACTRMYDVTPAVAGLWRELITRISAQAGHPLEVVDYPAPAPLDELWNRADLGAVFMCGWPFRKRSPGPQIVAAPVPVDRDCSGPSYCTDMVVDAASPYHRLEDTFGGRIAWTDAGSQSGFNAPRRMLLKFSRDGAPLYRESLGPLVTPRASLRSVLEGKADIAPLDSYFHALLRRHEPGTAQRLRIVARTEPTPIPLLIASREIDPKIVEALGRAFENAAADPALRPLLEDLCLSGFARIPDPERYGITEEWDREALAAGYPVPA